MKSEGSQLLWVASPVRQVYQARGVGAGRIKLTQIKQTHRCPPTRGPNGVFFIGGQCDGLQPIVYTLLQLEVLPAKDCQIR